MDAAEFQQSGLLYLANRTLHPYGIALAVTVDAFGKIQDELTLITTDDPNGFVFSEEQENECRARLAKWTRENWKPTG